MKEQVEIKYDKTVVYYTCPSCNCKECFSAVCWLWEADKVDT